MASRTNISVGAVALAGAAAVTIYAGMKGVGLASGFRSVLAGHPLTEGEPLAIDAAQYTPGAGSGQSSITAAAQQYLNAGHVYKWGGGSPAGWDCSGFTNWVLNHDAGIAIPGYKAGTFNGRSHGPVTAQWAIWSGCTNISRDEVQAGDLIVWPAVHMGIALDNTTMIHAPGPNGTPAPILGTIDRVHRGLPRLCRRLKAQVTFV